MTEPSRTTVAPAGRSRSLPPAYDRPQPSSLADLLERVLDKGVVLAGDIRVNLLDIELLTIKIRLLLVSVDKAAEMGIDWWRNDPTLSSGAQDHQALQEENARLRARLDELEGRQPQELGASGSGESGGVDQDSADDDIEAEAAEDGDGAERVRQR